MNSPQHTFLEIVLGKNRDGVHVDQSMEFQGGIIPAVGDTVLCYIWESRLTNPDSDVTKESKKFLRFRVVGRDFTFMRNNRHPEPQITDVHLFVEGPIP